MLLSLDEAFDQLRCVSQLDWFGGLDDPPQFAMQTEVPGVLGQWFPVKFPIGAHCIELCHGHVALLTTCEYPMVEWPLFVVDDDSTFSVAMFQK